MTPINVMINGNPGNVARIITQHIMNDSRFQIIPFSLTGEEVVEKHITLETLNIQLIRPSEREGMVPALKKEYGAFISVDYTHPSSVNSNAAFYAAHHLPFVMGTTGGDRDKLASTVLNSPIAAVIAPNMAKQIVGLQAMMEYAANTFPGLFESYQLKIVESHQEQKADTSGTAKAMVSYFKKMGAQLDEADFLKIRTPQVQMEQLNIPEEHLGGHGWHTYTLTSENKNTKFEFTHNINGRDIYASGTMDAILYLNQKVTAGKKGVIYSMIDVLKKVA